MRTTLLAATLSILPLAEASGGDPLGWVKDRAEDGLATARNVGDLVGGKVRDGASWAGQQTEAAIYEASVEACRRVYGDWQKRIRRSGKRVELSEAHRERLEQEFGSDLIAKARIFESAEMQRDLRLPLVLPTGIVHHVSIPVGVDAAAQTFGTDVFLKSAYDPLSDDQLSLLVHELDHADASTALDFRSVYCREIYRGVRRHGPSKGEAVYFGNALEMRALARQRDFACRAGGLRPWYLDQHLLSAGLWDGCAEPAGYGD
jgi:hypothetical protein